MRDHHVPAGSRVRPDRPERPTREFPPIREMHQVHPPEGFFNKSVRYANQAVGLLGTAKGVLEAGRYVYSGLQAARPLLAML